MEEETSKDHVPSGEAGADTLPCRSVRATIFRVYLLQEEAARVSERVSKEE